MAKSIITSHRTGPIPGYPPIFHSDNDALAWAVRVAAFANTHQAKAAFDALPYRGNDRWAYWIGMVGRKLASQQ